MQVTRNVFNGGMNKDSDEKLLEATKYFDAVDLTLTKDNDYGTLSPIDGSLLLDNIFNGADYGLSDSEFSDQSVAQYLNMMALVPCKVEVSGENKEGFAMFIARPVSMSFTTEIVPSSDLYFEIYLGYFLDNTTTVDTITQVYQLQTDDIRYYDASVDAILAGERNLDILYFTDQVNITGRLRCTVDEGTFTNEDINLIRQANMNPPVPTLGTDGSTVGGTYSFAVRMIDETSNLYTKFSLLSDPILVTKKSETSGTDLFSQGVGDITDKSIDLSIQLNSDIAGSYDYYQVAIVKNIDGNGIPSLTASLLEPKFKGAADVVNLTYFGDEAEETIDISDLTIDDAQIQAFKTINIKNNYLIGGNVTYADLSYDNGAPIVNINSGYNISTKVVTDDDFGLLEPYDNNLYYFRDEVYRFGITYHDGNGNWSFPSTLDFSSATNNSAEVGCIDYKFPTMFDEPLTTDGSASQYRAMEMAINGIQNHPSWAKGFAIVRAKRKKNIQFQTPVVPTMAIMPLTADTRYPQNGEPETPDAQPPTGVFGTLIPKNYRHIVNKHILRGDVHCQYYYDYPASVNAQVPKSGVTPSGEVSDVIGESAQYVHCIFPPNNIYQYQNQLYEEYTHQTSDYLKIIDFQALEGRRNYLTIASPSFDQVEAEAVTLMSTNIGNNWCRSGAGNPDPQTLSFIPENNEIIQYTDLSYGEAFSTIVASVPSLRSNTFGDHASLVAEGLNEGTVPNNHKMGVIVTRDPMIDIAYKFIQDASGLNNANTGTDLWDNNSGIPTAARIDEADVSVNGTFAEYPTDNDPIGLTGAGLGKNNIVPIANVERGLSDFRYGGEDDQHEFIFTGVYYQLSQAEVDGNTPIFVTVRGGDCSYDLHTFRISDGGYGLPDNNLDGGARTTEEYEADWGHSFYNGADSYELGRPIPYAADSQQISVFLESEIRATHTDKITAGEFTIFTSSEHTLTVPASSGDAKSPMLYNYNLDISLPNNNKIWVPQVKLEDNQTLFKSRLAYSDVRVYQSRDIGFDRFRVANIYDLDEARGGITKLINSRDNLYCLQERGFSYVPILGQVIETVGTGSLAVRSSEVISVPQYISTIYGTESFRSVAETPDGFYFVDLFNKEILKYGGGLNDLGLQSVSELGMHSFFDSTFTNYPLGERFLTGLYDFENKEYIIMSESSDSYSPYMVVFSEKTGSWVSRYSTGTKFIVTNGAYVNGELLMLGIFADNSVNLSQMYVPGNTTVLGSSLEPNLEFFVNVDPSIPKVYDVAIIDSNPLLDSLQVETFNTYGFGTSQETTMTITSDDQREGTYRIPILRDVDGRRMRGLYAKYTLEWPREVITPVELASVLTKYRLSERKL